MHRPSQLRLSATTSSSPSRRSSCGIGRRSSTASRRLKHLSTAAWSMLATPSSTPCSGAINKNRRPRDDADPRLRPWLSVGGRGAKAGRCRAKSACLAQPAGCCRHRRPGSPPRSAHPWSQPPRHCPHDSRAPWAENRRRHVGASCRWLSMLPQVILRREATSGACALSEGRYGMTSS